MRGLLSNIHIYVIIVVAISITDIFIFIIFISIIIVVVDIIKWGCWSVIPGGGWLVIVVGDGVAGKDVEVRWTHRRSIHIQLAVDEDRCGPPRHAVPLPLEQLEGGVGHALGEGHDDRTGFQPTSLQKIDHEK